MYYFNAVIIKLSAAQFSDIKDKTEPSMAGILKLLQLAPKRCDLDVQHYRPQENHACQILL